MSDVEALRLCGVCGRRVRQTDHRGAHAPKPCRDCGRVLPLRDFDEHSSAADGYRRSCRACVAAQGRPAVASPAARPPVAPPPVPVPAHPADRASTAVTAAERSTVYMLIGTIVHRAVLWPMLRPMTGTRLDAFEDAGFLVERASTALAVIERSLRPLVTGATDEARDDALAVLNLEGPWDTGSFEPLWESLGAAARREVFRGLDRLVENAATGVSNAIRRRGILGDLVTCAWAEVPLFALGSSPDPDGDDGTIRPDLVLWRARGGIEVIEIKVGNASPPDDVRRRQREQLTRYVAAVERRFVDDRSVRGTLVHIGRGPRDVATERL